MQTILAIAAGGAVGAVLRHFLNNALAGEFPWGIFACNVIGSFVMGALIAFFADVAEPPAALKAFLTVGMLGAFTTFSTFSLDAVLLWERGALTAAALYTFGSVALAIGALVAGMAIVRGLS
jgi:CrcB protein